MTTDDAANRHYVYLYRSNGRAVMYVGYGMNVERALSHSGASHNVGLREWLSAGRFELSVAGPYRDETEGRRVEAALISAIGPRFNIAPGTGPKFVPLGVPPALSDRPALPPLSLAEVGRVTGGALLVYLAPGDYLGDGRRKYDPAHPSDDGVLSNMEGKWDIGRHLEDWRATPDESPQVLLGIHGKNPIHRFIVGAARIDANRWRDAGLRVQDKRRWYVPLDDPVDLDAKQLRGRRVEDVKFGQFSWQLHIWVDGGGRVRHPAAKE